MAGGIGISHDKGRLEAMRFWRKRSVYKMNHKIRRPLRETETGRASFPASFLAGSMTVEAALVLPIFLFSAQAPLDASSPLR